MRCYTQNVDELEITAGITGSKLMLCHGTLRSARCLKCKAKTTEPFWWKADSLINKGIPECKQTLKCNGDLRPEMKFFGDEVSGKLPLQIQRDASKCDLVLVIGTSLSVLPVCEILQALPDQVPKVWINKNIPPEHFNFDFVLKGDCDTQITKLTFDSFE